MLVCSADAGELVMSTVHQHMPKKMYRVMSNVYRSIFRRKLARDKTMTRLPGTVATG
jgi:hypothetical protein